MQPSIFIGGVGGSGTRVLCSIAQSFGLNMGADFNKAQDALWFSLLFMHPGMMACPEKKFKDLANLYKKAFIGGGLNETENAYIIDLGKIHHARWTSDWVRERAESFIEHAHNEPRNGQWGWKEPNSHIFAERFLEIWPDVRYIHMWRDGVDMSISKNQNQIKFWGEEYPGGRYNVSKRSSLSYWVNVHKNIVRLAHRFPGRVSFLNFEDLCENPYSEIQNFLACFGGVAKSAKLVEMCELVRPPETIGRGDINNVSEYNLADYDYALNFRHHICELK